MGYKNVKGNWTFGKPKGYPKNKISQFTHSFAHFDQ